MKAAIVKEMGKGFVVEDVVLDTPRGREVLVDVRAVGLCHSDLTMSTNDLGIPVPLVLGHEVAGIVTSLGPDVTEFQVGDHVVGCLLQYCGVCEKCLAGKVFQCPNGATNLRQADEPRRITMAGEPVTQVFGLGGFAEQALIHEMQLVKVPNEVPFPQAALMGCAVVTGAGVVLNTAKVQAGETVVVVGVGGVGLNAISAASLAGAAKIIAVDVFGEKLEKAKAFGATDVVNSSNVDPVEAVLAMTDGGADAVFDFVGLTPVTEQALRMARVGGGLFLVGVGGVGTRLDVNLGQVVGSQRRIQGVMMGSASPKRDIRVYSDLYLEGRLNLDDLITHRISLDQINEGFAALLESSSARVVVTSF